MKTTDDVQPVGGTQSRRSFLRSSGGLATAVAVTVGLPAAAAAKASGSDAEGEAIDDPTTAPPSEPVMAYVHDADRGEVTIMAGTDEMTYRDPALVKRLLAAANRKRI